MRRAFLLTPESTPSEKNEAVGRAQVEGLHDIIRATEQGQNQRQRLDPLTLVRSVTLDSTGETGVWAGRLDFGGKGTGLEREESLTPLSDEQDPFA
jgi:hypothetical protein